MKNLVVVFILLLSACTTAPVVAPTPAPQVETPEPAPVVQPEKPLPLPAGDWNNTAWTAMAAQAVSDLGKDLIAANPKDGAEFHPAFASLTKTERVVFYSLLLSAMARYESGFKPATTYTESFNDGKGKPVVSRGLLQISQESANGYGCGITKPEMLHDPETNIRCGVRILNRWVPKDGYIAGNGSSNVGGARYWSVLRNKTNSKAPAIKAKVRQLMGAK
jgi:hypothetical protein